MGGLGRHKRVGLALGSGGARGWAHLGVLQALKEKGVRIDMVAGTSMGALVGAFLAAAREDVLRDLATHLDWKGLRRFFWEISLSRSGLTDGRKLLEETRNLLGVAEFRDLKLPFRAVATDLNTGGEVALNSGDLLEALRASISIPGVFSPVWVGRRLLVDGGLVNPVPVNAARAMGADTVIAVDVSQGIEPDEKKSPRSAAPPEAACGPLIPPRPASGEERGGASRILDGFRAEIERRMGRHRSIAAGGNAKPPLVDVLVRSVRIAEAQIARARRQVEPPDVLIEPQVARIGTLDLQRAAEAISAGYAAALEALR